MHLFVDNLTNIDFSYLDPERGLVGETWLASIELEGNLDNQGMVCDFGIVKKTARQWLDTVLDHCLLVPAQANALTLISSADQQQTALQWRMADNTVLATSAPQAAITLIDCDLITPDNVARWCIQQLRALFPETVARLTLSFTSEDIQGPFYHYSHGLKKHNGNCQRITHGHRSRIEIWRNDQLDTQLMQYWANQWRDIYIGTRSDLVPQPNDATENRTLENSVEEADVYHFEYRAQQGVFSLSLPASRCYLIDTDSTVEYIAQHITACLKQQMPEDSFVVKAFEGIGKGAKISA